MKNSRIVMFFIFIGLVISISTVCAEEMARIAILGTSVPEARINAFKKGLSEHGYAIGKNIIVEYQNAKKGTLSKHATELAQSKVNVIIAAGTPATRAAKKATTTIPIVMHSGNPVATGFAESLEKPGGNITGLTVLIPRFYTKRLELLKEAIPNASRIAVFWNPDNKSHKVSLTELQEDASRSDVTLFPIALKELEDIKQAFTTMTNESIDGFLVFGDSLFVTNRKQIATSSIENQIPAIYTSSRFVKAGGLMSYGVNMGDLYRRMGGYAAKIISGANPANMPIEQPQKFEITINLKSAEQIGLELPQQLLARADKKIE